VAAVMSIIVGVLLPAATTWLLGMQSIGLVAIGTLMLGVLLLGNAYQRPKGAWFGAGLLTGLLVGCTPQGRHYVAQLANGQHELQAMGWFLAGMVMEILAAVRLVQLNEDMPEYHILNALAIRGLTGGRLTRANVPTIGLRAWFADCRTASTISHARRSATSPWSRARRWQLGLPAGPSVWVVTLAVSAWGIMVLRMAGQNLHNADAVLFPMVLFLSFPLVLIWSAFWHGRRRTMGYESLLPVDRREYIRQLGLTLAIGQAHAWIAASVLMLAWLLLLAGQAFPLANAARFLAVFAMIQPCLFGLGAWFTRYRSLLALLLGLYVALCVGLMAVALSVTPTPLSEWTWVSLPVAGAIGMAGLFLTWRAYRRWLVTDFD
jgi:hypothetical protein